MHMHAAGSSGDSYNTTDHYSIGVSVVYALQYHVPLHLRHVLSSASFPSQPPSTSLYVAKTHPAQPSHLTFSIYANYREPISL
jgi:hypothetical protein